MSWFGDFIGGAAGATAQIAQDQMDSERKTAEQQKMMEFQEKLQEQKMKVAEELKAQKEKDRELRIAKEMEESRTLGDASLKQRDVGLLETARGKVTNEGEFKDTKIADSDVENIKKNMSPADAEKFYGIKQDRESGMIGAAKKAALDKGYVESYKLLGDEQKTAIGQERSADAAIMAERKQDAIDKRNEASAKAQAISAQASLNSSLAALKRAEKSGDAQAIGEAKTSATAALNAARASLSDMTNSELGTPRIEVKDGKPVGSEDDVKLYNSLKQLMNNSVSSLNEKFNKKTESGKEKAEAPPSIASIKGAPSGASIGSYVDGRGWEVKNSAGKVIGYSVKDKD